MAIFGAPHLQIKSNKPIWCTFRLSTWPCPVAFLGHGWWLRCSVTLPLLGGCCSQHRGQGPARFGSAGSAGSAGCDCGGRALVLPWWAGEISGNPGFIDAVWMFSHGGTNGQSTKWWYSDTQIHPKIKQHRGLLIQGWYYWKHHETPALFRSFCHGLTLGLRWFENIFSIQAFYCSKIAQCLRRHEAATQTAALVLCDIC